MTSREGGVMRQLERRKDADRRQRGDRRRLRGRRKEDRGDVVAKPSREAPLAGQFSLFGDDGAPKERRHGPRRCVTEQRRATPERRQTRGPAPEAGRSPSEPTGKRRRPKPTRLVDFPADSPWMNANQAAKYVGTTRRGLYNKVRGRDIRAQRRTGARRGTLMFRRADLDAYLEDRSKEA